MLNDYYRLTKPGIIRGNIMNAVAGFLFASTAAVKWGLMMEMLLGTAFVIACACVFNNYIDRGIDAKMARTKWRATVSGTISGRNVVIYGIVLGVIGFGLLTAFTNTLTVAIGATALILYVAVYGYFKRRSTIGTLVGSVPGALPPVAGYAAVTGRLDIAAVLIFLALAAWQMAHFYSIGLYRHNDYKAAGLPILPVVKGSERAKRSVTGYILAFTAACALLTLTGHAGYIFMAVTISLGFAWLGLAARYNDLDSVEWGKRMFLFSLSVILGFAIILSIGARLA